MDCVALVLEDAFKLLSLVRQQISQIRVVSGLINVQKRQLHALPSEDFFPEFCVVEDIDFLFCLLLPPVSKELLLSLVLAFGLLSLILDKFDIFLLLFVNCLVVLVLEVGAFAIVALCFNAGFIFCLLSI